MFGWFEQIKSGEVVWKHKHEAYQSLRIYPLIGWSEHPEYGEISVMGKTKKGKTKFRTEYFFSADAIKEFDVIKVGDDYKFLY